MFNVAEGVRTVNCVNSVRILIGHKVDILGDLFPLCGSGEFSLLMFICFIILLKIAA